MTEQAKEIKFAVVQSGYAVFGAGNTYDEAIADAAQWMEPENGRQGDMTTEQVEELLVNRRNAVNGDFYMLDSSDEEFDSYLENQGGFEKRDRKWYAAR